MAAGHTIRSTGHRERPGWTLLECLLAMAIMAVVFAAAVPLLHAGRVTSASAEPRILESQEARSALSYVTAALRQARVVTSATQSSPTSASIVFTGHDGTATTFRHDAAQNRLYYGPTDAQALLAQNCSALVVRCYSGAGQVQTLPLADPARVKAVEFDVTVGDPAGRGQPLTFTTQATLQRTRSRIVVNEVMYKPPGALGDKKKDAWVELHNPTSEPVDVAGWYIWTKNQNVPDPLLSDLVYSSGSTVIPPGGYALITANPSELYWEFLTNGDFEGSDLSAWRIRDDNWNSLDSFWWSRSSTSPYSGGYKLLIRAPYWNRWVLVYQDFRINSSGTSPYLKVRERVSGVSASNSWMAIFISTRTNSTQYTVYEGRMSEEWQTHTAALPASLIDRDLRVHVWVAGLAPGAYFHLDAIGLYASRLPARPADALHFWVDDDQVGDELEDTQVFVGDPTNLRDVVVFNKTWGGDGDGTTLTRTNPFAPSTEAASWRPGPYGGTPAAAN